jgi:hypothetical protein
MQHLRRAYRLFADDEIAAHLGEVLWVSGQRHEARRLWSEVPAPAPQQRSHSSHSTTPRSLMRLLAILVLGGLLSACSLRPPVTVTHPAQLSHWLAEGKLGLRVADRGGNLYFTWQQAAAHYTLTLSGPLGAGRTELSGGPEGVVLRNGELGDIPASSPEGLAGNRDRLPRAGLASGALAESATGHAQRRD